MNPKLIAILFFISFFVITLFIVSYILSLILLELDFIFLSFIQYAVLNLVFTIILNLILSVLFYILLRILQFRKYGLNKTYFNAKLEELTQNKEEISIKTIFAIYNLEKDKNNFRKILHKKVYEWVEKNNFQIQGERILLKTDKVPALIDELAENYNKWKDNQKTL